MNNNRQETKYNQIVGIKDGCVYVLQESFLYGSDGMRGCCGYSMGTLDQGTVDYYNDVDNLTNELKYLWKEAVASDDTEDSLVEFLERMKYNYIEIDNLYYVGDDDSYRYQFNNLIDDLPEDQKKIIEQHFGVQGEDFVDWQISGGGRCFDPDMEWDVLFRPDLIEVINDFERKETKDE